MQLFAFNRVLPGFCLECSNGKMENGGRFSDHQVDQLRRLGGGGGGLPKVPSSTYT